MLSEPCQEPMTCKAERFNATSSHKKPTQFEWHTNTSTPTLTCTFIPNNEIWIIALIIELNRPRKVLFFPPKTREREYCTKQTRIYMCCPMAADCWNLCSLWPCGLENSLQSVTISVTVECLWSMDSCPAPVTASSAQISGRHRWTLKARRGINSPVR